MDLVKDWKKIRLHFNMSFRSSLHVSIASVDKENNPTVTPIGSLFLKGDQTGFYFEKFPSKLPQHANSNKNVCILGVNSSSRFWLKSLFNGKFSSYPALKLYGQMGEKRTASDIEVNRLKRRMRMTRMLKGHQYLWGRKMNMVRDITFSKVEMINLKEMTKGLKNLDG